MNGVKGITRRVRIVGAGMFLLSVTAGVAGAGLLGTMVDSGSAGAIPVPQEACAGESLTLTPPSGGGASAYQALGPSLSINDGRKSYEVVAMLSIDGNVSSSTSSEMRASFSVDGATPTDFEYGPGNIHEGDGVFDGSSTIFNVIPLGPGRHTIQPVVRMNGASGTSGYVGDSCAFIEAKTS